MAYSDRVVSRSIDPTVHEMLTHAERLGLETAWDRYEAMLPQCGFGELGLCCRNCNMGPCRISPFDEEGPKQGICGATADILVARGLIRMIAAGAAAHSDHGRDIAHTLLLTAQGKGGGYEIKDEAKLHALAAEYGIAVDGRSKHEIALDLAHAAPYGRTNYVFDLSDPQTGAVLPGRYHFALDGMIVAVPGPWVLSWNMDVP